MKKYSIDDLNGYAWDCAIINVREQLVKLCGNLSLFSSTSKICEFARNTSMIFDCNGEFIK